MNKRIETFQIVGAALLTLIGFDVTASVKGKIEVSSGGKMDYSYVDQYPYGRCKIEHIPATDCKKFGYPFGTDEVVKASDIDKYVAEINSGTSHKSMAARIDYGVGGWGLPTSKHLNYAQNAGILIDGQTYLYKEADGTLGFASVGNKVKKFNKNLAVRLLMVTPGASVADSASGLTIAADTSAFQYAVIYDAYRGMYSANPDFFRACGLRKIGKFPPGSYKRANVRDPGAIEFLKKQIDEGKLSRTSSGYQARYFFDHVPGSRIIPKLYYQRRVSYYPPIHWNYGTPGYPAEGRLEAYKRNWLFVLNPVLGINPRGDFLVCVLKQ